MSPLVWFDGSDCVETLDGIGAHHERGEIIGWLIVRGEWTPPPSDSLPQGEGEIKHTVRWFDKLTMSGEWTPSPSSSLPQGEGEL